MVMNRNRRLLILAIGFIIFNVVVFAIPFQRNAVFWIAWFFSVVTILAQGAADWLAFRDADSLKRVFMGIPIIKAAYTCLCTQLTLCIGLMIAANIVDVPVWLAIVPCIIVLATGAVAVIKADWGRETIGKIEEKHLNSTEFIYTLRADIKSLLPRVTSAELKKKIEKLSRAAQNSDPVSSPGLAEIEAAIASEFDSLRQVVLIGVTDESGDVYGLPDEIILQLNERNQRCRALKQRVH